jgi:hypothetical protein
MRMKSALHDDIFFSSRFLRAFSSTSAFYMIMEKKKDGDNYAAYFCDAFSSLLLVL